MERVKEHIPLLRLLAHSTPSQRRELLRRAAPGLIHCLCECALNILKGNIKLTTREKTFLKKYKTKLRHLTNRKVPLARKKKVLTQRGGGANFLPTILKAVLSLL